MAEFQESAIHFKFNKCWVVNKYDEHRYFRHLSSVGLKGMDFLGIFEKRELVLIEVKNYRIRFTAKPPTAIYNMLENPELLAEKVKQKAEDTLQAIRVINGFYRRNWFYRLTLPLLKIFRNSKSTVNTQLFWTRAQALAEANKIRVILWLETEEEYEVFSREEVQLFRNKLSELLNASGKKYQFEIIDVNTAPTFFDNSIMAQILSANA